MKELSIEEKAKAYDGNYKVYTELINRLEGVKDAIKKQNYGIAMDILCKPYPEYQIITSTEKKVSEYDVVKTIKERIIEYFDNHLIIDKCFSIEGLKDDILKIINEVKFAKQGEQKPTELPKGEDYGIDALYAAIDILQKTLGEVDGYQSDDGILEHKCAIEAVNRLYKQKPWSEEDKEKMRSIFLGIEAYCPSIIYGNDKEEVLSWLKSLKDRYTWKPSDEQMGALKHASNDCSIAFADMKILATLYEQLKALHRYEQDT